MTTKPKGREVGADEEQGASSSFMQPSTTRKPEIDVSSNPLHEEDESQNDFQGGLGADLEKNLDMVVEKAAGSVFGRRWVLNLGSREG